MHINQPEHRHHPKFVVRAFPPLASLEAGPLNPTARATPGARGPQVRHGVTGASLVRAQGCSSSGGGGSSECDVQAFVSCAGVSSSTYTSGCCTDVENTEGLSGCTSGYADCYFCGIGGAACFTLDPAVEAQCLADHGCCSGSRSTRCAESGSLCVHVRARACLCPVCVPPTPTPLSGTVTVDVSTHERGHTHANRNLRCQPLLNLLC